MPPAKKSQNTVAQHSMAQSAQTRLVCPSPDRNMWLGIERYEDTNIQSGEILLSERGHQGISWNKDQISKSVQWPFFFNQFYLLFLP